MPDPTQDGLAARGVPERIWADEDTWFEGPGITKRATEYVRADVVAALIREAEARGMERAAGKADSFADTSLVDAAFWRKDGMPKTAVVSEEHAKAARLIATAIRAAAAALRKDEEPK